MKKRIPLGVRKAFEEILKETPELINIEFEKDSVVTFYDSDEESSFYFEIVRITKNPNSTSYLIEYLPSSEEHLESIRLNISIGQLEAHFKKWKTFILEANNPSPLFDDNFTQTYYENLEAEFEIIDKDAQYRPYSLSQQKLILKFLDEASDIINSESINDEDKSELLLLVEDTAKTISSKTKSEVLNKIRKIVAKAFKVSLGIGEKLLIEFATDLGRKMLLE